MLKVGGSQITRFGVPEATFSTSGNDFDVLIDFGCQKCPKRAPFGITFGSKRRSKSESENRSKFGSLSGQGLAHPATPLGAYISKDYEDIWQVPVKKCELFLHTPLHTCINARCGGL